MRPYTFILLLLGAVFLAVNGTVIQQKHGKVNITDSDSDGFYCEQVSFSTPFQSGTTVKVFPSLSHEDHPDNVNEASVAMVTSVDYSSFNVCIMEPSQPSGKLTLNWLVFGDNSLPQGVLSGSVSYNVFTSGSSCSVVTFSLSFSNPPKILLSVRHNGNNQRKDAMSLWAEDVTRNQFRVCLREMVTFSGTHENFHVDWVVLSTMLSADMKDLSSIIFPNTVQPSLENNYAYCQVENFTQRFHEPPTIILSANRRRYLNNAITDQGIVTWVKDVSRTIFEVCLKDLPGISGQHEPITVDYATIGDLDPCLGVTCDNFAVCRAFGPDDARCVCVEDCPSTERNVCASNGRSFDNICLFQLEVCQTSANYSYFHHGSCRGFPMTRGRRGINEVPRWSDTHCQSVHFDPLTFYPDKSVHVQVSVSHVNESVSQVHDAAVSWVEDVSENGFTFCVMESGRNEGPPHGFATVEWMAYQGAPQGGVSGVISIPEWWTGTKCRTVDISGNGFKSTPTVLVTAEHHRRGIKHDAASLWLEDVSSSSFQVCLRELQNFDGAHQDIYVNWLAFEVLERPLFTEHGSTDFPQLSQNPLASSNYAQCQDVSLSANYASPPTVLLSPKHSTSGNLAPKYNGITAWIESISTSGFKMCFKEFSINNRYDPVTVSFAVLRDICDASWIYYRGFCYERITSCETWTNASTTCMASSSNLAGIENAEEDVFVQHLHRGKPSWIGLNDQANEGVYLWTDGGPVTYTHWGPGISSPPTNQEADCIHSSGRENSYIWQALSCDNCQNFTCKKDYDECTESTHECDSNADCTNTVGSYTCQCRSGYTGDGNTCTDYDECIAQPCDSNADCTNTVGSYSCQCRSGYTGDGNTCTVNCGDPGYPSRGYRSGSFTYGSTVTFHCTYSGEALTGASSSTCQADSTWSNPTPPTCGTYGMRLVGTSYSNKGRLEVYHPSYGWSNVCDDEWDINDGHVVCRQLGYSGASAVHHGAYYGQGSTNYVIDEHPRCSGSESLLWNCNTGKSRWSTSGCSHGEDVSVDCY